ncbi:hypothetical protein C0J52_25306 [Blattella germanica]|nr:hypothetical protein C0J52_25306 [Blattella germanica]
MKIAFVIWLCLAFAESCPDNCKCSKYKIFCKDSRIRSLPQGLTTTQTLSMDGDILEHLNASVFLSNHGLRNLTTLVLINLQIEGIENCTFAALRNLEFLKITYNNLSHIWPGAFIGLDRLYHLDLSHNNLRSLLFGIFAELRTLRHLNLSFNDIAYLHHKMFKELSREEDCRKGDSLKSIDIQGNRMFFVFSKSNVFVSIYCVTKVTINQFEREDFASLYVVENFHSLRSVKGSDYFMSYRPLRGLYQLTYFNISHSNISRIPGTFLPDSQNLKILWIRQGEIDHLVSNFFHGLFHLSNLNLHGNALEYLEDNIFQDLIDLKYLTLSENNLTSINKNTFNGLARLRYLNLDHNRLSIIQMPRLKELILAGNEFV